MEAKTLWDVAEAVMLVALVTAAIMYIRSWVKWYVEKRITRGMIDFSRLQVIRAAIANQYVSGVAAFVRRKDGKMFYVSGRHAVEAVMAGAGNLFWELIAARHPDGLREDIEYKHLFRFGHCWRLELDQGVIFIDTLRKTPLIDLLQAEVVSPEDFQREVDDIRRDVDIRAAAEKKETEV